MDSLIRFCFGVDPEMLGINKTINDNYVTGEFKKIDAMEEYTKLYVQAKFAADYTTLTKVKEAVHG